MDLADKENLLWNLKIAYLGLRDTRDRNAIEGVIEPLLVGLTEEDRIEIGEQLWSEFYTFIGKEREAEHKVYPFTGLAGYFYIPSRGS